MTWLGKVDFVWECSLCCLPDHYLRAYAQQPARGPTKREPVGKGREGWCRWACCLVLVLVRMLVLVLVRGVVLGGGVVVVVVIVVVVVVIIITIILVVVVVVVVFVVVVVVLVVVVVACVCVCVWVWVCECVGVCVCLCVCVFDHLRAMLSHFGDMLAQLGSYVGPRSLCLSQQK